MAFSDPQSITIQGVTTSLPRVNQGNRKSEYLSADGYLALSASHVLGRRNRRVLRVDHSKISTDPFIPSQNVKLSMSSYLVFDLPPVGYSNDEALEIWLGLKTLASASSDSLIKKLLGGES